MKLKVTYKVSEESPESAVIAVSTVIEVSAESIADMINDNVFNEVYEKVKSKKKNVVTYGYISKIEDLD